MEKHFKLTFYFSAFEPTTSCLDLSADISLQPDWFTQQLGSLFRLRPRSQRGLLPFSQFKVPQNKVLIYNYSHLFVWPLVIYFL